MLLLSMLSTITDGFCGIVIPSCSSITVCIYVTANTTLRTPHIPVSAASSSAVFGHHQADFTTHNTETCSRPQDNVQCYKVVYALTSIQMACLHLPSISVNSSLQAVISWIRVIQAWVGRTDGHQIRSVHRTPPSASEEVTNSLCRHYVND
jgi:hypothetical protein